jgi:hypothetical protein
MHDSLSEARNRAQRYWYRDGLGEMATGILCLLQGGWLFFDHLVIKGASWGVAAAPIYLMLLVAFILSVRPVTSAVRARITYPRSGYVYKSGQGYEIVTGIVAGLLIILTYMIVFSYAKHAGWQIDRWLPALTSLTTGAIGVYVTMRYGLPRFLIVGVFSVALGVAVGIEHPLKLGAAIWLAGVGCAWLCSGGLTLKQYVRIAPRVTGAT